MNLKQIYQSLLKAYGPQGWWPIINNKTLLCEYPGDTPRNESELLEIAIGALLTQNTVWYPNTVRALQQLKLGRLFTPNELKLIERAEALYYHENGHKGVKIDYKPKLGLKNNVEVTRKAEIRTANISRKAELITKANILTQNTSWQNVMKTLRILQEKHFLSAENLEALPLRKLASLIKSSGYFNQKAKKIKAFLKFLKNKKKINRENLLNIWGIGQETADSILLYAYHQPFFVIDTYTKRIFSRIGLCKENAAYEELQFAFHQNLKPDTALYNEYHALLVEHAKRYCRKKPLCEECPLLSLCRHGKSLNSPTVQKAV